MTINSFVLVWILSSPAAREAVSVSLRGQPQGYETARNGKCSQVIVQKYLSTACKLSMCSPSMAG